MIYPPVLDEYDTLNAVLAGKSIARYGDGEFKIAKGGECVSQARDPKLSIELSRILVEPNAACIIGIPTMDPRGPKYAKWARYANIYPRQLHSKKQYYSAFISRPDSAPWINTKEFFDKIESLWRGKSVTLVACGERSLTKEFLYQTGAYAVNWVQCKRRDAYAQINELQQACLDSPFERVILCAGPAATCLAWRLSSKKHAVDLGHIGMFWRAYANSKSALYQGL
jgi:hypothetical protein